MPEGILRKKGEHPMADAIRDAVGAGPDEEVHVTTPQFERTPDMATPASPPETREDWDALRTMTVSALKEMGLQAWNEPDKEGKVLMLFPGEWYPHIPKGLLIEDINTPVEEDPNPFRLRHAPEYFEPGVTDNDIRFGCLAYGVRVPA